MKHKNGITMVVTRIIRKEKGVTTVLFMVIISAIVFALVPPLILRDIVNKLTKREMVSVGLAGLYFGMLVLSGLFDAAKEVLITKFGQKVTRGLRHMMCDKLSRLPASYYTENEAGVITSRFVNDVDTVESLFTNGIISMVADACKMAGILVMIFVMSKGLGVMMLLVTPLLFVLTRQFQKSMLQAQLQNRAAIAKVNNHVPETIQNIRMIHVFGKETYMEERYDTYIEESYKAMEKSNFYDAIYSPIILVISAVIIAIMMVLSARGGTMQEFFGMSVGTAVAIIAYVGKVFEPIESIGMEIENIQSAMAGSRRINAFLSEKERIPTDTGITIEQLQKNSAEGIPCIHFDQVTFGYEVEKKVLEGITLTVLKGESLTLTGRTGIGKSTIFKLLLGMYAPEEGTVSIYGVPATSIPDQEKRKLFGYVEQSFHMVPGTVADQITLYDVEMSKEQVEQAARSAGIHDYIVSLPKKYDTICTEALFSKGQLQLLAIARAMVANPPILLLDEMTANVDAKTEETVVAAIKAASKDRTVVSISHRLFEKIGSGRLMNLEENKEQGIGEA